MTILYIGLGMAMMSAISAMMQVGNNVNNLINFSAFKQNSYYQTSLPRYDREIMDFLNNYSGLDSEVCSNVKDFFKDTSYLPGEETPSKNILFQESCVLFNTDLQHRVLINKNKVGTYNLFSCFTEDKVFCDFEEGN